MKLFVGVGACYLDTILRHGKSWISHNSHALILSNSVPRFVAEDEKLRASALVRRRGGNCPNTIEVLQQLLDHKQNAVGLGLLAVLPNASSAAVQEIRRSLGPNVNTSMCLYRKDHCEPASSYIIRSLESGSRTIINYNALPDMAYGEFVQVSDSLGTNATWYHFEGRIPDVAVKCIRHLRKQFPEVRISVELEKPERQGLQALVHEADVVFYSKGWANGNGYQGPEECLRNQATLAPSAILLCCTWGDQGASTFEPGTGTYLQKPAHIPGNAPVVDTIGAGDTFIAGILYSCLVPRDDWTLLEKLTFANELAGRKVTQEGFANLVGYT